MKVLIAAKETKKEFFDRNYGPDNLELACSEQEQDVQKVLDEHSAHHSNLESLISAFKSNGIEPVVKARVNTPLYSAYTIDDFKAANVIVSFGGDGEVLDVARLINKKNLGEHSPLVWAERADHSSLGALTVGIYHTYDEKVKRLAGEDYRTEEWARTKGIIKVKYRIVAEDLALDDIYFGDVYAMGMARYTIHIGDKKEYQMSSGGIISTQVGMQAWLLNVRPDLEDQKNIPTIDKESRAIDYIIREPSKRTRLGEMLRGKVPADQKIVVVSAMNYDGCVSFDGSKPHYDHSRCYEFNRGMVLEVSASDDPLRVIRFDDKPGEQITDGKYATL